MAANYLVIGSKFRPFSYAEMLAPVQDATTAHKDLENAYSELATKAGVWEKLANETKDVEAYNMYSKYMNDLKTFSDVLATEGLNPLSRQNMLNMKNRYSQEIVPIENAYNTRMNMIKAQTDARTKDSTMLFDFDASDLTLDKLITNPSMTYTPYSGALITKMTAEAASNLARQVRTDPRTWRRILGDTYWETKVRKGATDAEILRAINETDEGKSALAEIKRQALGATGIDKWDMPDVRKAEIMEKANYHADMGLWSAIGTTEFKELQDPFTFENARNSGKDEIPPVMPSKRRSLYTQLDTETRKNRKKEADQFIGKDKLGNWYINKEASLDTSQEGAGPAPGAGQFATAISFNTARKEFLEILGLDEKSTSKEIEDAYYKYSGLEGVFDPKQWHDTNQITEYFFSPSPTWGNKIETILDGSSTELYSYTFNKKGELVKKDEDPISIPDGVREVVDVSWSVKNGVMATLKNKEDNTFYKIKVPNSVNADVMNRIDGLRKELLDTQNKYKKGLKDTKNPMTTEEIIALQNHAYDIKTNIDTEIYNNLLYTHDVENTKGKPYAR